MPDPAALRIARRLSWLLLPLIAGAAGAGLLLPGLYRDHLLVASGWRGNDLVTLVLAVPLLAWALASSRRGSPVGTLLWLGLLLYACYDYAFYLFGAAYNPLFLVYVAVVGLSGSALGWGLAGLDVSGLPERRGRGLRAGAIAVYLALVAIGLGGAHLAMAVSALRTGRPPAVVIATGHPTNVVAALDLLFVVAPSLVAARWLLRREARGVTLAAVLCVKGAVYLAALTAATVAASRAGAPVDGRQALLWGALAAGYALAGGRLLAGLRRPGHVAPDRSGA